MFDTRRRDKVFGEERKARFYAQERRKKGTFSLSSVYHRLFRQDRDFQACIGN